MSKVYRGAKFSMQCTRVWPAFNWVRMLRAAGLDRREIACYIAVGRSKVLDTKHDPYRDCKTHKALMRAIHRDAEVIEAWFAKNKSAWTAEELLAAERQVINIKNGPLARVQ